MINNVSSNVFHLVRVLVLRHSLLPYFWITLRRKDFIELSTTRVEITRGTTLAVVSMC